MTTNSTPPRSLVRRQTLALATTTLGLMACGSAPRAPASAAPAPLPPSPPPIRRAGIEAAPQPAPQTAPQPAPVLASNPRPGVSDAGALQRITVLSCINQKLPMTLLDTVTADAPGLVLFAGDNVYASQTPFALANLDEAYRALGTNPSFQRLRAAAPSMAVWDDHDYGQNDAGVEFAAKQDSKNYFLNFWGAAADDPRRSRDGVYSAQTFGPVGQRVQVIMLDVRWNRSSWQRTDQRDAPGKERYVSEINPNKTILGAAQWQWFENQLRQPAEVRLVVSGIQMLADGHGWERWGLMPLERQRLFDTIARTNAQGVVLLSGDRHIGAIYRHGQGTSYPLTEMTSSGVTHAWETASEAGPNRLGDLVRSLHFGTVEIDWATRAISLQLKDIQNRVVRQQVLAFASLRAKNPMTHIK